MKLFITGICGFVGSSLASWFHEHRPAFKISGIDDFAKPGSEINRSPLRSRGITVQHADIRNASDFESLPAVDWVIDATIKRNRVKPPRVERWFRSFLVNGIGL